MKRFNSKILFSPQDLLKFLDSPYALWKDREFLLNSHSSAPKSKKEEVKVSDKVTIRDSLFNEGNLFEEKIIKNIMEAHPGGVEFKIEKDANGIVQTKGKKEATLNAIKEGVPVIAQAYLEDDTLYGFADLLQRVEIPSSLGSYSYVVKDIKRSQIPKAKFVLQILCYCQILSKIQGHFPETAYIILGNGEEEEFKTADYLDYFEQVVLAAQDFVSSTQEMPFPDKNQNHGAWAEEAEKFLEERQDISLLPDISKDQIKLLRIDGINSIPELLENKAPSLSLEILKRLKIQADAFLNHRKKGAYLLYPHSKSNPKGLNNLPKTTPYDAYIDIKFSDSLGKEGFIFLATLKFNEKKSKAIHFEAPSRFEEEDLLRSFLSLLENKISKDGKTSGSVYFYSQAVLDHLVNRCSVYDLKINFLNNLIFFDRLIDLQAVVKQSLALPVKSFSFDDVLNHVGEQGFFAEENEAVLYSIMLHSSDENLKLMAQEQFHKLWPRRIGALQELHLWLLEVQKKDSDLSFVSFQDREEGKLAEIIAQERAAKSSKEEEEEAPEDESRAILKDFTFSEKNYHLASPTEKASTLVKQFGKYHSHEKFPSLLTKKTILKTDDIYLDDEPLTLSNLELIAYEGEFFTYSFPKQETKLKEDDEVCIKQNPSLKAKIESLDMEERNVILKFPKKRVIFAQNLKFISVLEDKMLPDKGIRDKILKNITELNAEEEGLGLNKAMSDFLLRKYPDVKGVKYGEDLYAEEEDLIEAAIRVVNNMKNTSLIFQGPPGAGKTFTTAKIILDLVAKGKKIGISSNSHKAIDNVLLKLKEMSPQVKILKQQSKVDEELSAKGIAFPEKKNFDASVFSVVGGTVYALVRDSFDDYFDYLFIDEAGQVSLANLFAMSKSAKNIILIGDQMQLEQPTQALHPGDSGQSILEYFLNGYKTIPKSFGFFLPITRRMNPELTKIISENFYEGKLQAHESTKNNRLVLTNSKIVKREKGFQFIKVEHQDNIIYSLEEVAKIKEIVADLLNQEVEINGVRRPLEMKDIIFVSPYNMQVKKIKEALPDANVGSVDLFQGQEAPVVIVSLASSQAGGRGIEFLLSENRMNVALSRGKCLAILVANPGIAASPVNSLEELRLLNIYCKLLKS